MTTKKTIIKTKYIELLKRSLIDYGNIDCEETYHLKSLPSTWKTKILTPLDKLLRLRNFGIFKLKIIDKNKRLNGYDWPSKAKTMVGLNRLNNVEYCVNSILKNNILGDFVETGVWRGGVIILISAILEEKEINDRFIWAFDSFEGLPKPNSKEYPIDKGNKLYKINLLSASLDEVQNNYKEYNISTERVIFKKGWFKDTLPNNDINKISLLRLDGDLYESTILSLTHLYPKVVKDGYIIIDDYNAFHFCKKAVDDYRRIMKITDPIIKIDKEAIYWQNSLEDEK